MLKAMQLRIELLKTEDEVALKIRDLINGGVLLSEEESISYELFL
jgi:hypothetical protein